MLVSNGRSGYSSQSRVSAPRTPNATSPTVPQSPTLSTPTASPRVFPRTESPVFTTVKAPHDPILEAAPRAEPYSLAKVDAFDDQIESLRQEDPGLDSVTLSASPAAWAEIKEKYGDAASYKLEYVDSNLIVVTWPSQMHESFVEILGAFKAIEAHSDSDLQCRFNESINLGPSYNPVPDFVLARKRDRAAQDAYLVILEFAASETEPSLSQKALRYFRHENVQLVITIDAKASQYHSPASPVSPQATVSWDEFLLDLEQESSFGPIKFRGKKFANGMDQMIATVYTRNKTNPDILDTEEFDITPINTAAPIGGAARAALVTRLNKLTRAVALATRRAIGPTSFDRCFDEANQFDLKWDVLHTRLITARQRDAYFRYKCWNEPVTTGALRASVPNPLKRPRDDEDENEEEKLAMNRFAKQLTP
ncbi:hypothetical protein DFH09DRAFT_1158001 [Mycena vulgaris]|nr:hypothetical protein DFH09DRAFT_1158001 [Mycena vulgaris]